MTGWTGAHRGLGGALTEGMASKKGINKYQGKDNNLVKAEET